jgi:replicative DNA helicase Mcm
MPPSVDVSAIIEKFEEFFNSEPATKKEFAELKSKWPEKKSFFFSFKSLEQFDPDLADELMEHPDRILGAARDALIEMAGTELTKKGFDPHIRIEELPDSGVLIQAVGAAHINKLLAFQGVITKRAEMRPRVKIAVYRCARCDNVYKIPMEKGTLVPEMCEQCRKRALELDEDASYFVNLQRSEAQELLERVRGGAPAAHLELMLEDDLVNKVIPGDTIDIIGIVRIRQIPKVKGQGMPVFAKYVEVVSLKSIQREFEEVELSKEDIKEILSFAKRKDSFEQIVKSISPSIYGYKEVKEALALQLFGGTTDKTLPEGGRLRSDIHILLIGDPGAAKTRLLQYIAELAPKSIYVSGKSVTAVGLTASAERDELGEGWTLKAGALVLASGGLGCIDEFGQIEKNEQAALLEVMESQTVSIAKAGIVAKFRARTAILAAANPRFGRFDPNQLPVEQFDIQPTILSRFDLIFPIKDVLDAEKDRKLAKYMLASHRDAALKRVPEADEYKTLSAGFLRKYIAYARKTVKPILSPEAAEKIENYYAELRKLGESQKAVAITPRQIEGLVRLSEASAKARLSSQVEIEDSERAIRLTDFVLRQIAFDKTTGTIDIDIISSGQPRSRAEQYYDIVGIIRDLTKKSESVSREEVMAEARRLGVDEPTTRRFIDEMLRKGELYEPKPGQIKLVQKQEG